MSCVTSSAAFHLDSWLRRFWPAQTLQVDDLEEELSCARIEDEQGAVGGLGGHVALVRLVCGDAVHIGVVDEPDDLVGEELAVVGRVEVGLCGL